MNNELTHGAKRTINNERQQQIEQLYFSSYGNLKDIPFEVHPALSPLNQEPLMARLVESLPQYRGRLHRVRFESWASRFLKREAKRFEITERLLRDYRDCIRGAIRNALLSSTVDYAIDVEDVFGDFSRVVFLMAHDLEKPGTAKMSSRLYGLAQRHTWSYYTHKRNRQHALIRQHASENGGTLPHMDCYSAEELAAMKAEEEQESYAVA